MLIIILLLNLHQFKKVGQSNCNRKSNVPNVSSSFSPINIYEDIELGEVEIHTGSNNINNINNNNNNDNDGCILFIFYNYLFLLDTNQRNYLERQHKL